MLSPSGLCIVQVAATEELFSLPEAALGEFSLPTTVKSVDPVPGAPGEKTYTLKPFEDIPGYVFDRTQDDAQIQRQYIARKKFFAISGRKDKTVVEQRHKVLLTYQASDGGKLHLIASLYCIRSLTFHRISLLLHDAEWEVLRPRC
jgi:hypothetical protein